MKKKQWRVTLNKALIVKQGLSHAEVKIVQMLHETRLDIEEAMHKTDKSNSLELRKLANDWTMCQFELQKAWKFPHDGNFHQFWTMPKCTCPYYDNRERYPNGPYIFSQNCPIHKTVHISLKNFEKVIPKESELKAFAQLVFVVLFALGITICIGSYVLFMASFLTGLVVAP